MKKSYRSIIRAIQGKPGHGATRAMRRQSMGTFKTLGKYAAQAEQHDKREGWLPHWKRSLIEVKPLLKKVNHA